MSTFKSLLANMDSMLTSKVLHFFQYTIAIVSDNSFLMANYIELTDKRMDKVIRRHKFNHISPGPEVLVICLPGR